MLSYYYNHKKYTIIGVLFFIILAFLSIPRSDTNSAGKAALFLSPATGTFLVGSTFDLSIVLDTKGAPVNTLEVELEFPADKIQIANPSIGRSVVQVWAAPPTFSNREGGVYFVGGVPSPGIVTSDGVVLTLTFRVIAPGDGEIRFGKRTSVLANDGKGTDILGQKPPAFFKFIVPPPQGPEISSPTHPDQERWYRDPNPVFAWSASSFADGYSYSIDDNPNGFPDTIVEGGDTTVSLQNVKNGISYFHLRARAGGVWGGVSHYVVKIDDQSPAGFKLNVSPSKRTTNHSPVFRFFTTDSLSGLDHFKIKIIPLSEKVINESFFFEVTSPYQAPRFDSGRYQVIVRAIDKAGNGKDASVTMHIIGASLRFITPEGINLSIFFLSWMMIINFMLLVLFIFAIVLFLIWRHNKYHLGQAFKKDIKSISSFFTKSKESNEDFLKDDSHEKHFHD